MAAVTASVRCLTAYLPRRPNRPRLPGFIVFDEAARLAGPLIVGTPHDSTWSAENATEVEAGWITRGHAPGALAAAVGALELATTLNGYGTLPDEFGRTAGTVVPLEPPLDAIEMYPPSTAAA
jgi:hypothetical protein